MPGAGLVAAPDAEAAEAGLHVAGGQWPVLGLEALLDLAERAQRAVERRAVVRRHHARAQQRAARRHRGVQRDVDEHARVVERAPQQHGLPVVLDQHGDDRRRLRRADHAVAERVQAVLEVARVLELAGEQRRPVLRAHDPQRGERGADRGGHGGGGEQERARLDAQVVDDLVRAGDEAAAGGERLRERPHPQVDAVLDPEQLGRPGPARAEHAGAVRLVDHQARAVGLAQLDDLGQRGDVALHREDAVDDDEDPAAVVRRPLQRLLELLEPVVAEHAQLRAREQAAVEDRGVVAGVGDHGVAGGEDRPERPQVGLVAGGEDDRLLRAHPLGELALELEVERRSCR